MNHLGKWLHPLLGIGLIFGAVACSSFRPTAPELERPELRRGWSFVESSQEFAEEETGGQSLNFTSGVVVGDRLIYSSSRFGLIVFNKNNAQILWRKKLPATVSATVLVRDKKIFVGADDGFFRAYDESTGDLLWEVDLRFPVIGTPILAEGRILVGSEDHAVHALDALTGKSLWTFRRGASATSTIRGGGNAVFAQGKFWVGFADGSFLALNPNDGAVLLERQYLDNPKFTDIDATPVPWKQGLLVSSYDGKLRYLGSDGAMIWSFPGGGGHPPVVSNLGGGTIFASSSDGYVYALNDQTAKELWRFPVRKGVPTGIGLFGQKGKPALAVASSDNFVYLLEPQSGKKLAELSLGSSSGSYANLVSDPDRPERFFLVSHFGRIHEFIVHR